MAPWEKVWIKLPRSGNIGDLDDHLKYLKCVDCHKGNPKQANNKEEAHKGLVPDPSEYTLLNDKLTNSCDGADCHGEGSNLDKSGYKNSLHQQLWGEKRMVALRSGASSFETCPQTLQNGFNGECTSCHATCGDCHISIPNSAGKGLVSSHRFKKTPNMEKNCTACHGSRIAHDFYGDEDAGRKGDVHYAKHYMDCFDCHSGEEMHKAVSDKDNTNRYNYEHRPTCEDCHAGLDTLNTYHSIHLEKTSCYVCHAGSTPGYNNCNKCHVAGEWKNDPEYKEVEGFKIGINPLKSDERPYNFTTLRHIPVARTTYDNWGGTGLLVDYDKFETWKHATPHSIQRWTAQTDTTGGKTCSENCHLKDGKIYLFEDYINTNWPDEVQANKNVVVDGRLPTWWSK